MSQSYVKECTFCKKKIRMSDQVGKWNAYNLDNSIHDCKKNNGIGDGNNDISLEMMQKKLESIGITINLEKLMSS